MYEKVPEEMAAVKTVRALKKLHGDRQLAAVHCRGPQKRIQGNGGSQKNLADVCKGMTRCAILALHKGHSS
jgi:hypothetical protein